MLPDVRLSSKNDRPPLIRALLSHLNAQKAFKRHLNQMGISFDPGLCGAPGPEPFFSWMSSTKDEWESGLFLLLSFSSHSFHLSTSPLHPCSLTHLALACSCSSLLSPWIHEYEIRGAQSTRGHRPPSIRIESLLLGLCLILNRV